jgi:hypothetical protein
MQPIDTRAVRACIGEAPFLQLLAHRALHPPPPSSLAEGERLRSLREHCSLRSLRLALVSRCLPHSLADKDVSARSIVQDSGAPAWLRAAARDSRRSQLSCGVSDPAHTEGTLRPVLSSPTPPQYCPLASANAANGRWSPC